MDAESSGTWGLMSMEVDPYFSPEPMTKPGTGRRGGLLGRILVIPLLTLSGCHMLLTGSPIPLWHIERLNNPVTVTAIEREVLVLADGRRVRLPFIKRLPQENAVFVRALRHGVEVGEDGRVFGLIEPPRMCGNDPVVFYRFRANLSELASVLDPSRIDESVIPPEAIQEIKDLTSRSFDRNGLPYFVTGQMARVRRTFEWCAESRKALPERLVPRPRRHNDRPGFYRFGPRSSSCRTGTMRMVPSGLGRTRIVPLWISRRMSSCTSGRWAWASRSRQSASSPERVIVRSDRRREKEGLLKLMSRSAR